MKITVFGSSGKVGQLVVAELLTDGHTVVAFVHKSNPFEDIDGVSTVQGTVSDTTAVEKAMNSSDAIISTLGSWGVNSKDVVSAGTTSIINSMQKQGVSRLITLTGASALYKQDKPTVLDKLTHSLLSIAAGKILKDGENHLKSLEASQLEWTTIRSPIMTSDKSITYKLTLSLPSVIASIPRSAVARCLVDQLIDTTFIRKAPVIRRG